jgi:hypothetical protein
MQFGKNLEYCLRQTGDDKQKEKVRIYIRLKRNKKGDILDSDLNEKDVLSTSYTELKTILKDFDVKSLQGMKHPDLFLMSDVLLHGIVIECLEKEGVMASVAPISEKWKEFMKGSEFLK